MSKLNLTISRILLAGLVVAITLLLVGAILTLARPSLPAVHETSLGDIPRALRGLEPVGFFDLGLLALLATPVVRIVALLLGFTRRRMWLFSGLSLFVLAALALSAFLGLGG